MFVQSELQLLMARVVAPFLSALQRVDQQQAQLIVLHNCSCMSACMFQKSLGVGMSSLRQPSCLTA